MYKIVACVSFSVAPFAFLAALVCGATANNSHSHVYAVAGWVLLAVSAALVASGVTAVVIENDR